MKKIITLIKIPFIKLRNLLGIYPSTKNIPVGYYCYSWNEKTGKCKYCPFYKSINKNVTACTFTGYIGDDYLLSDSCKICNIKKHENE
jgi:hypothetical protein